MEKKDNVSDDQLKGLLSSKKAKKINSRTKGNAFERKIADMLNKAFNTTEFCRSPGSGAFATTHKLPKHLQVGGDLLTPQNFPYIIECKKGYSFKLCDLFNSNSEFMKIVEKLNNEAVRYSKKPLLIFQQDRANILCLLNLESSITEIDLIQVKDCIIYNNMIILKFELFLVKYTEEMS